MRRTVFSAQGDNSNDTDEGRTDEEIICKACFAPHFYIIGFCLIEAMYVNTGFPIKDARFSKLKNIPDILSDDKEGKITENID